jgi:hypothetical protein
MEASRRNIPIIVGLAGCIVFAWVPWFNDGTTPLAPEIEVLLTLWLSNLLALEIWAGGPFVRYLQVATVFLLFAWGLLLWLSFVPYFRIGVSWAGYTELAFFAFTLVAMIAGIRRNWYQRNLPALPTPENSGGRR